MTGRKKFGLLEAVELFGTPEKAEKWFESIRWPDGKVACPRCGSLDIGERPNRFPAPYRCSDCGKDFSVRTDTLMHGTNLPLNKWAIAVYLIATNPKGVSVSKLSNDLGVGRKTAWHLLHRIRETWCDQEGLFNGPVEVDETYFSDGTKVIGMKDRDTGQVVCEIVDKVSKESVYPFILDNTTEDAKVYTDGANLYRGLGKYRHHEYVVHRREWARGDVHTNGIESFWGLLKRGYRGIYQKNVSRKHFRRYLKEFEGRYNQRVFSPCERLVWMVKNMIGKRVKFKDLTG